MKSQQRTSELWAFILAMHFLEEEISHIFRIPSAPTLEKSLSLTGCQTAWLHEPWDAYRSAKHFMPFKSHNLILPSVPVDRKIFGDW